MAKKNSVLTASEIKAQLEEAELRAKLGDARARVLESALSAKKARLMSKIVNEDNVLDFP